MNVQLSQVLETDVPGAASLQDQQETHYTLMCPLPRCYRGLPTDRVAVGWAGNTPLKNPADGTHPEMEGIPGGIVCSECCSGRPKIVVGDAVRRGSQRRCKTQALDAENCAVRSVVVGKALLGELCGQSPISPPTVFRGRDDARSGIPITSRARYALLVRGYG